MGREHRLDKHRSAYLNSRNRRRPLCYLKKDRYRGEVKPTDSPPQYPVTCAIKSTMVTTLNPQTGQSVFWLCLTQGEPREPQQMGTSVQTVPLPNITFSIWQFDNGLMRTFHPYTFKQLLSSLYILHSHVNVVSLELNWFRDTFEYIVVKKKKKQPFVP